MLLNEEIPRRLQSDNARAGRKRNISDVGKRIFTSDIFTVPHFAIERFQVALDLFLGFLDLIIVRYVSCRGLEPGVAEIDPDTRPRTVESVARHQRYRRIFFLQVLIDDGRFVDHSRAVDQDRNFPVRVKL